MLLIFFNLLIQPPAVPEELVAELAQAEMPIEVTLEDTSLHLSAEADPDVYHAFIDEAPANTAAFSLLTAKIAQGDATIDDIRTAKRIAHSFKGSANIVGIRGIAALGHHTEDILEHFEKSNLLPPKTLSKTLLQASDCLAQMVGHLRGEEDAPDQSYAVLSSVVAWANKVRAGEDISDDVAIATAVPMLENAAAVPTQASANVPNVNEAESSLRVSTKTVDELFRLVSELTTKIGQMEDRLKQASQHTKTMLTQNLAVQQRVMDMDKLVVLRGLSLQTAASEADSSFDPLELDRYNELHGATRALVEVVADSREIAAVVEEDVATMQLEILQQAIVNKDLQYQILSTRLAPISMLSARLQRNVRQTALQTGKEVALTINGSEILIDGDVLNKLADPLLHILRNAVDHGIEPPEARLAQGKPPIGQIVVDVQRLGSTVTAIIKDDGRGFDYPRIREKAIVRGLIADAQDLTESELARLTLLPGFSTRDAVSEVSGRGVGMDVVSTRLAELKGSVDLASTTNVGTVITLRLQASLVTQHSLMIRAAEQIFAIPTYNIAQVISPGAGQMMMRGEEWHFAYNDNHYPLHDLAALTGYPTAPLSPDEVASHPIILITANGHSHALVVSQVIDSRELIIKSMGRYLRQVHGVSGASILGDGTIVPILNVNDLVAKPLEASEALAKMADEARRQARRIVVVDDSLSVRKSLTQLFEDAAFEVRTAADGLEAIRLIDEFVPHAVCTDLEMPNMNGLELTQHLRQKSTTSAVPIMMITSRSMDKHREQAARAGVNEYVTKPYVDFELLKKMRALIEHDAVAA